MLFRSSGIVTVTGAGHYLVTVDGRFRGPLALGSRRECFGKVALLTPLPAAPDDPATPGNEADRVTAWLVGRDLDTETEHPQSARSEGSRVGKRCVRTCKYEGATV